MKNIHILGNGSSISLFDRNSNNNDDVFVGCNFSSPELNPNYVSIIDMSAMVQISKGTECIFPAIVAERCASYAEKNKLKNIEIIDVFPLIKIRKIDRHIPMNSGQHATIYSIEKNQEDVNDIHLWGFDSFWTDDISSSSDKIVVKNKTKINPRIARIWHKYWNYIFSKKYPNKNFFIHSFQNEKCDSFFQKNVKIVA